MEIVKAVLNVLCIGVKTFLKCIFKLWWFIIYGNVQSIGVGLTSFAQGAGVTITSTGATASAPILRARYSAATIICTASNVFTIVGDLS
jgi:hypothetical protein